MAIKITKNKYFILNLGNRIYSDKGDGLTVELSEKDFLELKEALNNLDIK